METWKIITTRWYNGDIDREGESLFRFARNDILDLRDTIKAQQVEIEALKVKAGNMSQDKECDIIQRDERIFELQTENEALMRWLKRWQSIATNIKTIEGGFRPLDELVAATKAVLGE